MAESCVGACLDNTAVNKCTSGGFDYCLTKVFNYATLDELVTEWDCDSEPSQTLIVYDELLSGAVSTSAGILVTAAASSIATNHEVSFVGPSPGASESTSAVLQPTTTSTTPVGPVIATPNAVAPTTTKSGLPAGAIAGIVVGAILLIGIILGLILLYRYFKGRNPKPQPPQLAHDPTPQPPGMATVQQESPPLSSRPSNFTMPSNTPLIPHTTNELGPDDSASNVGGPYSMVSQAPLPDVSSEVNSYPSSQSALGAPQFSAHNGVQPVASPGIEFGSMPPADAPEVNPGYTFVPKGPQ